MTLSLIAIFALLFLLSSAAVYLTLRIAEPWSQGVLERINISMPTVTGSTRPILERFGKSIQSSMAAWMPGAFREENWQQSPLRVRCVQAGYRDFSSALVYLGSKALLAVLLPVATFLSITLSKMPLSPMGTAGVLMLSAGIGFFLPNWVLRSLILRRQRQLVDTFPDALDLIRICVEAGLGLDAAIQRISQEFKKSAPALAEEFNLVSLELRAGAGRAEALRHLAQRTGVKEINAFVTMLIQADRFGTGIAESIRTHADQLRLSRRLKAEEIAATISTRLLFPLIFCIFPALLLVLMGPAGLSIQQHLIPAAKTSR
jgi:tight adherence protein C